MKHNAIKWLWNVTGTKKFYVGALMLVQALHGASGVLYALLLRNIVDSAVDGNRPLVLAECSLDSFAGSWTGSASGSDSFFRGTIPFHIRKSIESKAAE